VSAGRRIGWALPGGGLPALARRAPAPHSRAPMIPSGEHVGLPEPHHRVRGSGFSIALEASLGGCHTRNLRRTPRTARVLVRARSATSIVTAKSQRGASRYCSGSGGGSGGSGLLARRVQAAERGTSAKLPFLDPRQVVRDPRRSQSRRPPRTCPRSGGGATGLGCGENTSRGAGISAPGVRTRLPNRRTSLFGSSGGRRCVNNPRQQRVDVETWPFLEHGCSGSRRTSGKSFPSPKKSQPERPGPSLCDRIGDAGAPASAGPPFEVGHVERPHAPPRENRSRIAARERCLPPSVARGFASPRGKIMRVGLCRSSRKSLLRSSLETPEVQVVGGRRGDRPR